MSIVIKAVLLSLASTCFASLIITYVPALLVLGLVSLLFGLIL